ncbi:unnamed protein product [Cuscuta campestris]|uniref:Uncharacterized protein n=1 Tax=Cuscuta campestris TaxID=132261 RepID=A0A484NKM9_9ASTE|nr:unnamed protein product [Cuscuta campestris]
MKFESEEGESEEVTSDYDPSELYILNAREVTEPIRVTLRLSTLPYVSPLLRSFLPLSCHRPETPTRDAARSAADLRPPLLPPSHAFSSVEPGSAAAVLLPRASFEFVKF